MSRRKGWGPVTATERASIRARLVSEGKLPADPAPEPAEDRPSATEGPGPGYAATLVLRLRLERPTGHAEVDLPNLCARLEDGSMIRGVIMDAVAYAGPTGHGSSFGPLRVRWDLEERT